MARATTYAISESRRRPRPRAPQAKRRFVRGLTLIEMLVVVAVIVLLAGFVVSLTGRTDAQAKERALGQVFAVLKSALQEYHEFTDAFPEPNSAIPVVRNANLYASLSAVPASRQALQHIDQALVKRSGDQMTIYDPWGTAIDYRYRDGDSFPELVSAGPDKTFDTRDDISSRNM